MISLDTASCPRRLSEKRIVKRTLVSASKRGNQSDLTVGLAGSLQIFRLRVNVKTWKRLMPFEAWGLPSSLLGTALQIIVQNDGFCDIAH